MKRYYVLTVIGLVLVLGSGAVMYSTLDRRLGRLEPRIIRIEGEQAEQGDRLRTIEKVVTHPVSGPTRVVRVPVPGPTPVPPSPRLPPPPPPDPVPTVPPLPPADPAPDVPDAPSAPPAFLIPDPFTFLEEMARA